jgi:hypothetical protein
MSQDMGDMLIKARVDFSKIEEDIRAIQKKFDSNPIKLKLSVDEGSLRDIVAKVQKALGGRLGGSGGMSGSSYPILNIPNATASGSATGGQLGSSANSAPMTSGGNLFAGAAIAGAITSSMSSPVMGQVGAYTAQGMSCANCGSVVPQGSKWCPRCGQQTRTAMQKFMSAARTTVSIANGIANVGQGIGEVAVGAAQAGYAVAGVGARAVGAIGHAMFGSTPATLSDVITNINSGHEKMISHLASISNRLPTSYEPAPYGGPSASDIGSAVAGALPRRKKKPRGGGGGGGLLERMSLPGPYITAGVISPQDDPTFSTLIDNETGKFVSKWTDEVSGEQHVHMGGGTISIKRTDSGILGRGLSGNIEDVYAAPVRRAGRRTGALNRSGMLNVGAFADAGRSLARNIGRDMSRMGGSVASGAGMAYRGVGGALTSGLAMKGYVAAGVFAAHMIGNEETEHMAMNTGGQAAWNQAAEASAASNYDYSRYAYTPLRAVGAGLDNMAGVLGFSPNLRGMVDYIDPVKKNQTIMLEAQRGKMLSNMRVQAGSNSMNATHQAAQIGTDVPFEKAVIGIGSEHMARRNAIQRQEEEYVMNKGDRNSSVFRNAYTAENRLTNANFFQAGRDEKARARGFNAFADHVRSGSSSTEMANKGKYLQSNVESVYGDSEAEIRSVRDNKGLLTEERDRLISEYTRKGQANLGTVGRAIDRAFHGGTAVAPGNFINYAQDSARDRLPQERPQDALDALKKRQKDLNNVGSSENSGVYADRKASIDFQKSNGTSPVFTDMLEELKNIANDITKVLTAQ